MPPVAIVSAPAPPRDTVPQLRFAASLLPLAAAPRRAGDVRFQLFESIRLRRARVRLRHVDAPRPLPSSAAELRQAARLPSQLFRVLPPPPHDELRSPPPHSASPPLAVATAPAQLAFSFRLRAVV